jgi:hypothetical protein
MFVDSDDWMDLDTCEVAYNSAMQNSAEVVMWSYISESATSSTPKVIFKEDRIFNKNSVKEQLFRNVIGPVGKELAHPEKVNSLVSVWGKMYKTSVLKNNNINFFDLNLVASECLLFNLYVFAHIDKAVFINKNMYHYRRNNDSSLTKRYEPNLYVQWQYLLDILNEYIDTKCPEKEYYEAFNNRVCLSLIPLGTNLYNINNSDKFSRRIRILKNILNNQRYKNALKNLSFKYLPLKWKVFFGFAKFRIPIGVYTLSTIISLILRYRQKVK